jgi:hypothetical protein
MSLSVTSVEISLSDWFFHLMGRINLSALTVVKEILTGLCPHFRPGHPVPTKVWVAECHRPVHHLQVDLLEPDLSSREL